MQLGIFAKTFPGSDPQTVLAAARGAGFAGVQFNLSCAGLPAMPESVPEATVHSIRQAARNTGVALQALSGTYNMIHPDPAERQRGLARLGAVIGAARALGIPIVTLCTGTRDATDQWRHHPANGDADAWVDLTREMGLALRLAEQHGVILGIEPEFANVVSTPALARRLIRDMGSDRLRVILDPANLFESGTMEDVRRVVAEAVEETGDLLAMAHAKDRARDGGIVAAGHGVVDFADFLARLRHAGFAGPLVTHGLAAEDAAEVAAFLGSLLA